MIRLISNANLQAYNTFGVKAAADMFFEFTESTELVDFMGRFSLPVNTLVLGGGSNVLLMSDYHGLVIHPNIPGIIDVDEDRQYVYIEAGAGVEWDDLVEHTVLLGLGGLENLSLIPGRVGAAPVQNIGAYGAEAKDCIMHVRAVSLKTGKHVEFSNSECQFAYRDSIFKNELKGEVVITSVLFKLNKFPELNMDYGDVNAVVSQLGDLNVRNIRQAIVSIRESKLPDHKVLGNAGSFFKNPVVDAKQAFALKERYPNIPLYESTEVGKTKVAAGWLIDQCGWKGKRIGNAGVHQNQALVLVNHGNASGEEIMNLANEIRKSVLEQFGIELEPEVNIV